MGAICLYVNPVIYNYRCVVLVYLPFWHFVSEAVGGANRGYSKHRIHSHIHEIVMGFVKITLSQADTDWKNCVGVCPRTLHPLGGRRVALLVNSMRRRKGNSIGVGRQ